MQRRLFLSTTFALVAVTAPLLAIAAGAPISGWLGWGMAISAAALAGWIFGATLSAWQDTRLRRVRRDRLRTRAELLLLVRDLREACASASAARDPREARAGARWIYERCCERLLDRDLRPAPFDPLAHDLVRLRVAIRAVQGMLALRPEQLHLIGSPFRLLVDECDELLEIHGALGAAGRMAGSIISAGAGQGLVVGQR